MGFFNFFKTKKLTRTKGVEFEIVKGLQGCALAIMRVDVGHMPPRVAEAHIKKVSDELGLDTIKAILGVDKVIVVAVTTL